MKLGVERARVPRRGEGAGSGPAPAGGRRALAPAAAARRSGGARDTDAAVASPARGRYRKVFACAAEATESPDGESA